MAASFALAPVAPASAHSGHFSCGTYSWTVQSISRVCFSSAPGAAFRVWTVCYYVSGTRTPVTRYGNWRNLNNSAGTSTATCPTGYEPGSANTQFTHN